MDATFTVRYVNHPQAGKKKGTIKTTNDEYYLVTPAMLSQFSEGGTYTVSYEAHDFRGKTYKTVQAILEASAAPPKQQGKSWGGGGWSPEKEEQVFVTALLKSFIEAGRISPNGTELKTAIGVLRGVWGETFGAPKAVAGAPKKTTAAEDMNDGIPF